MRREIVLHSNKSNVLKGATLTLALSGVMMLGPSSTSYAALGDQDLTQGMNHSDVAELQQELKNLGLYWQNVNNHYGSTTESAVRAFQANNGLNSNGTFDKITYNKLVEVKNAQYKEVLKYNRALRYTHRGQDVKQLQEALKALGYLNISNTTEYFGVQTRSALLNFQKSLGLQQDGSAGPATISALNRQLSSKGISSLNGGSSGSQNNSNSNTNNNTSHNSSNYTEVLKYGRALRYQQSGQDVQQLQEALKALGYLNITNTTQYFGTLTRSALVSFQAAYGLDQDASAGPATFKALNKALNEKGITSLNGASNTTPSTNTESSNNNSNTSNNSTSYTEVIKYSRALRYQQSGHDVQVLQEALKALGYLNITNTTQYFGTSTRTALLSFQAASGLDQDASAGPATFKALNQALSAKGITTLNIETPVTTVPSSSIGGQIANLVKQFLGQRYIYGGSLPGGFDCSGLTSYVYKQFGITIPRTSAGQATFGQSIARANVQPGDILIYTTNGTGKPSHVGIYIGDNIFVHASNPTRGVVTDNINSNYYASRLLSIRRPY